MSDLEQDFIFHYQCIQFFYLSYLSTVLLFGTWYIPGFVFPYACTSSCILMAFALFAMQYICVWIMERIITQTETFFCCLYRKNILVLSFISFEASERENNLVSYSLIYSYVYIMPNPDLYCASAKFFWCYDAVTFHLVPDF